MSLQLMIALTTGVLSGFWFWTASQLGLLVWAGFLGCTTYFASPDEGIKGLLIGLTTNLSGIFWAMVIITFSSAFNIQLVSAVITAVVAFIMCLQAKRTLLRFIPGTFVGACATFAADGNWRIVLPSLIGGLVFGYLMKFSGVWLHKKIA